MVVYTASEGSVDPEMYRQYNIPIKPGRITIAEHRLMTSLEVPRVNHKKYAKETLTILSE